MGQQASTYCLPETSGQQLRGGEALCQADDCRPEVEECRSRWSCAPIPDESQGDAKASSFSPATPLSHVSRSKPPTSAPRRPQAAPFSAAPVQSGFSALRVPEVEVDAGESVFLRHPLVNLPQTLQGKVASPGAASRGGPSSQGPAAGAGPVPQVPLGLGQGNGHGDADPRTAVRSISRLNLGNRNSGGEGNASGSLERGASGDCSTVVKLDFRTPVRGDDAGGPSGAEGQPRDLSFLIQALQCTPLDPTSARGTPRIMQRLYRVTLDRRGGKPLGLSVSRDKDETLIISRILGGLVESWNELNPDAAVKCGDRVIAVNGLSGNAEVLRKECERAQVLDMTFQRARVLVGLQPPPSEPSPRVETWREGVAAGGGSLQGEEASTARGGGGRSEADEAAGTAEGPDGTEGAYSGPGVPECYQGEESLRKLLADGDVVLLRGSWLAELARCQQILPRRQDLPEEAIWVAAGQRDRMEIAAVSYCWRTPEHPDPDGRQLQLLGRVIDGYIEANHSDIAVFIDWASLYQLPRSPEEQAAFMQSLCHVNVWYAHRQTWKWMLTALPKSGSSSKDKGRTAGTAYEDRGWPSFEWAVSQLAGVPERVLDLGRLGQIGERCTWAGIVAACATTSREPPIAPEAFAKLLEEKAFTHSVDRAFIEATYRRTFEDLVASAEVLDFSCLGWGNDELRKLVAALPLCTRLRRLYLSWNRVGDPGVEVLAAVLPRCSRLCKVGLAGNPITSSGKLQFREAWARAGKHEEQLDLW